MVEDSEGGYYARDDDWPSGMSGGFRAIQTHLFTTVVYLYNQSLSVSRQACEVLRVSAHAKLRQER